MCTKNKLQIECLKKNIALIINKHLYILNRTVRNTTLISKRNVVPIDEDVGPFEEDVGLWRHVLQRLADYIYAVIWDWMTILDCCDGGRFNALSELQN